MKKIIIIIFCVIIVLFSSAFADTYIVIKNVNERTGPSTDHDIVTLRTKGETLEVRKIEDGWAKLKNGHYVWAKNIATSEEATNTSCYKNLKMVVCVSVANIRAEASKKSEILRQETFGTSIIIKERNGDWFKIKGGGYIHNSCVSANIENYYLDKNKDVIFISKNSQTVKQYDDKELKCNAQCVTGAPATDTPCGVYKITKIASNVNMGGSDVKTAMYFNGNIALHDASWRHSFGGTRYLRNGSHGCVNVSEETMDTIAEFAKKGTLIIVYE